MTSTSIQLNTVRQSSSEPIFSQTVPVVLVVGHQPCGCRWHSFCLDTEQHDFWKGKKKVADLDFCMDAGSW